ncbi:DUF378 domain-containing protein [Halosegnis marinus]|uniref:DUF378 domain-containing protein n=1 Tax=Halosegnis marinus TaxID=3034023 RepID=A0ABD5ZQQ2_9EURY|nr:DUF378 domain-containing protein [Halosegnis sp. DT85]
MQTEGRLRVNAVDWISLVLVIVGAINWGLVGIGEFLEANWNVVNLLLGSVPTLEFLVYVLVGLAGIYELYFAYQLYSARGTPSSRTTQ